MSPLQFFVIVSIIYQSSFVVDGRINCPVMSCRPDTGSQCGIEVPIEGDYCFVYIDSQNLRYHQTVSIANEQNCDNMCQAANLANWKYFRCYSDQNVFDYKRTMAEAFKMSQGGGSIVCKENAAISFKTADNTRIRFIFGFAIIALIIGTNFRIIDWISDY